MRLPGQCLLEVRWRGDVNEEAFTIKCRTEELLRQWQRTILKAVEESPNRRRGHHLSNGRRSDRGVNSPLSQFPGTPLSEVGPSNMSVYSYSASETTSPHPYANSAQPAYPPNSNGFDDEGDDGAYEYAESGRSTPSTMARRGPSTRWLPPGEREERERNGGRARAQTEDSSSAVIHQWRNQTPNIPSLPRGASHASITSNGSESQSLRSSASTRQLRSQLSTEWGSANASPGSGYSRLPVQDDDSTQRQGLPRQASQSNVPSYAMAPPMRNRSISSPNVYQIPGPAPQEDQEWPQQQQYPGRTTPQMTPSSSAKANLHRIGGTNSGGTIASGSSASVNQKRFSSSSNGTDRSSGTSSQSAGQTYTAATSPANTLPGSHPPSGSLPPLPNGASRGYAHGSVPTIPSAVAVRVKVTYGEDTFVVVVLSSVSYRELLDKVLKKIRLCGDRTKVDVASLRLRYQDEDGDRILVTSEEDVTMAFEAIRAMGNGQVHPQTLVLFASVDGSV